MTDASRTGAVVFAKDLAPMAAFYEQLLGMTVAHAEADHVVLDGTAVQLVIHAIPPRYAKDIVISDPPAAREDTPIKLFFPVPSLADARACAPALGGRVFAAGREWEALGFRACDALDPEGNVLQLREAMSGRIPAAPPE